MITQLIPEAELGNIDVQLPDDNGYNMSDSVSFCLKSVRMRSPVSKNNMSWIGFKLSWIE
jgi:hypothetical protein